MEAPLSVLSKNISLNTGKLADAIVAQIDLTGCCTNDDLINQGFTLQQVTVLGADARRIAAVQLRPRNLDAA